MEDRVILHSDLNSFYASVEMMLDPSLRGKAVAVCGSTEDRHGIVLAKSDLAKKAGIKTGMVNWEARQLCKDLIVVPPHYDQYLKYSKMTQAMMHPTRIICPFTTAQQSVWRCRPEPGQKVLPTAPLRSPKQNGQIGY